MTATLPDREARFSCREKKAAPSNLHVRRVDTAPYTGGADIALTVYKTKSNQWREYMNPLRGVTLESIVAKLEQGERGAFADLQWFYQGDCRSPCGTVMPT